MARRALVGVILLAAVGPSPLWYLTRGTGLVALLLLTMTVALGVLNTGRWTTPRWPRFATGGLHRNVSLVVVVVLGIHIVAAELDTFAPVGWLAVVVPFASAYRPIWLGLGTVAFDLLLALVVTSLARRRIGQRAWRAIHWVAYLSWPLALVHGLGTGTDPRTPAMQAVTLVCAVVVIAAAGWRLAWGWRVALRRRLLVAGLAVVACFVVAGWAAGGPLQAGWARRAGTPTALVASPLLARATVPVAKPAPPVSLTLARDSHWTGQIVALDGDQMAAAVTDATGSALALGVNLQIDPSTEGVTGAITVTPPAPGGRS
jgi:hypothetical protein